MILVTTATGSIGSHLVRRLREAGVPFRAMVRDRAKGERLGGDFVVADFDDRDAIAAAMTGVDRLFLNAGGAVPAEGEQPMVRQQRTMIDAAVDAGVAYVVKVSVWGAQPGGKLAEGAHWEIEQHLKASGTAWSILRPSGFMQNFVTGAGAFAEDGNLIGASGGTPVSYIDCRDIADSAAALLTGPGETGGTYVLTGPQGLSQIDIAARLSTALGREVRHIELTPAEMTARLIAQGLPRSFAADVAELWQEVGSGSLSGVTTAVRDLTGHEPRTFDEFLADHHDRLTALSARG